MEAVVCRHFKFGYCKFGTHCRYQHVKQECENSSCNISLCDKRHPIVCRFFLNFGRCKFSPCSYKHERGLSNGALEKKIYDIEKEVKQKDAEIKELKRTIDDLQQTIKSTETNLSELENSFADLMEENQEASMKIDLFENNLENYFAHLDQNAHSDRLNNKDEINEVKKAINNIIENLANVEKFLKSHFIRTSAAKTPSTILVSTTQATSSTPLVSSILTPPPTGKKKQKS